MSPKKKKNGFGFLLILLLAAAAGIIRYGMPSLITDHIVLPELQAATTPSVSIAAADSGAFDTLYAPYYAQLSDTEQTVYRQLYQAVTDCADSFEPEERISTQSLKKVTLALWQDQPQLFWWEGSYSYRSYQITPDMPFEISPSYNELAHDLETHQKEFDAAANEILSKASALEGPQDRELFVHDSLIDLVTYTEDSPYSQTAYSALVNHETVCAGYTRAFQYLMIQLDIPCYYCPGTAAEDASSTSGAHSWNIIQLNNQYYNIDITWDDIETEGLTSYLFFNRTDSFFEDHFHTRSSGTDTQDLVLPACTETECCMENLFGVQPILDSLADRGISAETVAVDTDSYFRICEDYITKTNARDGNISMIVWGDEALDAIKSLSSDALNSGYLNRVFRTVFYGCSSFSYTLSSTPVGDQYYYVSQSYTFS
ncbi:MAG: hypothetical protein LUE11_13585 [Clostridia bacterium]|nr:hypothetical protein [Clostridia bacterium]